MCLDLGKALMDNSDPLGLFHKPTKGSSLGSRMFDPLGVQKSMKPKAPEPAKPMATPLADAAEERAARRRDQTGTILASGAEEPTASNVLSTGK